jgi:hypothetical protein
MIVYLASCLKKTRPPTMTERDAWFELEGQLKDLAIRGRQAVLLHDSAISRDSVSVRMFLVELVIVRKNPFKPTEEAGKAKRHRCPFWVSYRS